MNEEELYKLYITFKIDFECVDFVDGCSKKLAEIGTIEEESVHEKQKEESQPEPKEPRVKPFESKKETVPTLQRQERPQIAPKPEV